MNRKIRFLDVDITIPSSILLKGPMAAAKPVFAQKFIVNWINMGNRVLYFATSSPIDGVLRNLEILGLNKKNGNIVFADFVVEAKKILEINDNLYKGNFSDYMILRDFLTEFYRKVSLDRWLLVIPSFTLLLMTADNKIDLVNILITYIIKKHILSMIAVNSEVLKEYNSILEKECDMTIEFRRKEDHIFYKIVDENKWYILDFPDDLFQRTKKEVAQRTGSIIRKTKSLKRNKIYIDKQEKLEGTVSAGIL